jgi:hypothetical protein
MTKPIDLDKIIILSNDDFKDKVLKRKQERIHSVKRFLLNLFFIQTINILFLALIIFILLISPLWIELKIIILSFISLIFSIPFAMMFGFGLVSEIFGDSYEYDHLSF